MNLDFTMSRIVPQLDGLHAEAEVLKCLQRKLASCSIIHLHRFSIVHSRENCEIRPSS